MKKISTAATLTIEEIVGLKLTLGLDLGDRSIWYCVLDESGQILLEEKDRAHLPADLGRSASFSQEPRRGLLCGFAAGAEELGAERTAVAHQQGRRSLSANAAGAGSASHSGPAWRGQRSAALGVETSRARRKEWKETSCDRHRTKAGSLVASFVGKWRGLRTNAQQSRTHVGSSLDRGNPDMMNTKPKAEFR